MSDDELSREQLEEQLMAGEYEEGEEGVEEEVRVEPEVQAEEVNLDEMQERIRNLEQEISSRTAAMHEERDRRRVIEGQHAQLMDYLREARERAGQAQVRPEESYEDDEYGDFIKAWERRYGEPLRVAMDRLHQLEQYFQGQQTYHNQAQQFAMQSQQFKQQHDDYEDAVAFLINKARRRAEIFIPDASQREQVVQHEVQRLMYFTPEKLYSLAKEDGYSPRGSEQAPASPGGNAKPVGGRPKSLGAIPGGSGEVPLGWEAKAQKVIDANFDELSKLPLEELDRILKKVG